MLTLPARLLAMFAPAQLSAASSISASPPIVVLPSVWAAIKTMPAAASSSAKHSNPRNDSRAKRYRHVMTETMKLHAAETAILCVLMLRGAQTVGEIRTRTARMAEFRDLAHVEVTLQSLTTLSEPLVTQLPR